MNFDSSNICLVLNHGDFWLENLLITEDQTTKKPVDVVFTNPQVCFILLLNLLSNLILVFNT